MSIHAVRHGLDFNPRRTIWIESESVPYGMDWNLICVEREKKTERERERERDREKKRERERQDLGNRKSDGSPQYQGRINSYNPASGGQAQVRVWVGLAWWENPKS